MGWLVGLTPYEAGDYSDAFWTAICRDGATIAAAHVAGVTAALENDRPGDGGLSQMQATGDLDAVLRPARWGQWGE